MSPFLAMSRSGALSYIQGKHSVFFLFYIFIKGIVQRGMSDTHEKLVVQHTRGIVLSTRTLPSLDGATTAIFCSAWKT